MKFAHIENLDELIKHAGDDWVEGELSDEELEAVVSMNSGSEPPVPSTPEDQNKLWQSVQKQFEIVDIIEHAKIPEDRKKQLKEEITEIVDVDKVEAFSLDNLKKQIAEMEQEKLARIRDLDQLLKEAGAIKTIGELAGGLAGGAIGGASPVPGGGIAGGLAGSALGEKGGEWLEKKLHLDDEDEKDKPKQEKAEESDE